MYNDYIKNNKTLKIIITNNYSIAENISRNSKSTHNYTKAILDQSINDLNVLFNYEDFYLQKEFTVLILFSLFISSIIFFIKRRMN